MIEMTCCRCGEDRRLMTLEIPPHIQDAMRKYRWEVRDELHGRIRTSSEDQFYGCPITAACKILTDKRLGMIQWEEAANLIGLSREMAERIVYAADGAGEKDRPALMCILGMTRS